jgi:hypothetical protein
MMPSIVQLTAEREAYVSLADIDVAFDRIQQLDRICMMGDNVIIINASENGILFRREFGLGVSFLTNTELLADVRRWIKNHPNGHVIKEGWKNAVYKR